MKDRSFYFKNGKRAVLLFHAYSSTPNDVRMLGRELERNGYTVYSPTFSGHGTHDLEDVLHFPPTQWFEDGEKAVQFLKEEGFKQVAVFGLSLGGIVATKLMLDEEEVLASGTFSSPAIHSETSNVGKEFLSTMVALKRRNGETKEAIEKRLPELEQLMDKQLSTLSDIVDQMSLRYSSVTKPIFIGQSGKDKLIDSNIAYELRDAFMKAEVDFHWYENSPHAVTIGPERKELQQDILNFLSRLEWTEDSQ